MKYKFCLLIFLFFCIPCLVQAAEPVIQELFESDANQNNNELALSLKESIILALKNNMDIEIEKITPGIAEADVVKEESEFDTNIKLGTSASSSRTPSTSVFATPNTSYADTFSLLAGVEKRYATGTKVMLEAITAKSNTDSNIQEINSEFDTKVTLSLTQHLLKNFGKDINSSRIKISSLRSEEADLILKSRVINIIAALQQIYWDLVFAREDLIAKENNLELAKKFEERIKKQVEIGVMAPIEITMAKAEVSLREEEVIISKTNILNIEDELKHLLNLDLSTSTVRIIPKDKPVNEKIEGAFEEDFKYALLNRPDYLKAKIEIETLNTDLGYKKNQLLPYLDLSGAISLKGIGGDSENSSKSEFEGTYGKSYEDLYSGKYYDLNLSLILTMPLGNRSAKSELLKTKLEAEQKEKILKNLEKKIELQILEARRKAETSLKRIEVTAVSRKLAVEKLAAEETKFKLGVSTSFNVLEFQRDLTLAISRELLAMADYNKSLINLDVVTGRVFEKNNIALNYTTTSSTK